jgi:hypothetical protein
MEKKNMKKSFTFSLLCSVVALGMLCSCGQSRSTDTTQVGDHKVVIVDTSGRGGSSGHDKSSGSLVFTHDSGNCKVRLENEVLIVNGKKYLIPNKNDSIRIEDGQVEINGKSVKPESE